jgi:NADH:quinone reductase (non-electrogenic)
MAQTRSLSERLQAGARQQDEQHRIVVLGAGYTGLMCAIRVARRSRRYHGQVTLVGPSPRFTERLRMHQTATGQRLAEVSIPDLLTGTGVDFVQGWASRIDPVARTVQVDGAGRLTYDTLVYAIGSVTDVSAVPGADTHAYTLNDPQEATRLADRLAEIPHGTVAVCGGGLTGIEAATEIAESHPGVRVVLLTRDTPGSMMSDRARGYLNRALSRLGVEVRAGVEVTKVLPDAVELAGGELVPVDACLWTTGFVAPPLAARAGYAVDRFGRIVVDATLRSVSHPATFAIGDAAAIRQPWGTVHGTCQSGIPSGAHAADEIVRSLRGRAARPFRFGYIHQPVSLGRRDAVIQFTRADDSPRRWLLTGRLAVLYKEFVTSSPPVTYRMSRRFTIPKAALSARGPRSRPASPDC